MMTPERLAEWRKFALEAIPQLSRLSDKSESERVIISACATVILELIDALATEAENERCRKRSQLPLKYEDFLRDWKDWV